VKPQKNPVPFATVPAGTPDLVVHGADLPATARAVANLLSAKPLNIFERDGVAVIVTPAADGGAPTIRPLTVCGIIIETHKFCQPVKPAADGRRHEVTLSNKIAELYLAMPDEWRLRPLSGVTSGPILRDDGSIRTDHGYDPETQLWCCPNLAPAVTDAPSLEDAKRALATLRHPFRTHAFADRQSVSEVIQINGEPTTVAVVDLRKPPGKDESAFLVALLTAVVRPSLPLAPAAVFRAPAISGAGTGKGLLARAISLVAFGQQPHAAALGDGNEFDKGLAAELLRGDPSILIDNLNRRTLRSPVLCTALSEHPAMLRILGASEMRPTNSKAFIAITGNALTIAEDLVRRVITIDVDAQCENPEQRKFAGNFLADISCHRGELLAAALCIWRFGRQSAPTLTRGQPLGGFEPWSQWVRDPLLTLGCQDPIARMSDLKSSDPDRVKTVEIFQSWWEHHEDGLVKASELADEVQALIVPGPKRTRQDVASRVAKLVGTQVGGFRLTSDKGRKGKGRWAALQYQLIQRAEDEASNEDADGSNKAEPQHADPCDNAIPKRPPASAGTDPFGLDDEAFAQMRASQHLFQIIGPELSAPCAQCGLNDGKVYLIRCTVGTDIRSHPLHHVCAQFWFKTRAARTPHDEHVEPKREPASNDAAQKNIQQPEPASAPPPPSDPIERWRQGFGRFDPLRDPCPGFRTNEWARVHHTIGG
jgi:putative DNA primase/helicase